jgi:hypothetical protein
LNIVEVSSGEHQHTILVTPEEIMEGAEVTLLSSTTQGHSHFILITAADFALLKSGLEVRKKSCSGVGHEWVLNCGSVGSAPGTPTCSDMCGDGTTAANACR